MSRGFQDDLPKIVGRALGSAWELYKAVGSGTLSEEVARPSLASHLVALAKEGVTEDGPLVAAGLRHLVSLATSSPFSKTSLPKEEDGKTFAGATRQVLLFRIVNAHARFLLQWHIRWESQFQQNLQHRARSEAA